MPALLLTAWIVALTTAVSAQPSLPNLRAIDLGTANCLNATGASVFSSAHEINNYGQVTTVVGPTGSGRNRGFIWQPDSAGALSGTMVDLEELFGAPRYTTSYPRINEDGQIMSVLRFVPNLPNTLTGSFGASPSYKLPNRLQQFVTQTADNRAARLDPPTAANPTGLVVIGPVAPEEEASAATSINEFGQVTISVSGPGLSHTAYLWTPYVAGGTTGIATRIDVPSIATRSGLEDLLINDRGQVLVVQSEGGFNRARSDLWTPSTDNGTVGSLFNLSDLVGRNTFALDLNNRGEALFIGFDDNGANAQYYWSSVDFGLINLSEFVFADSDPARDLVRFIPQTMNDFGQFAGTGWWRRPGFPDETRATLVVVPEASGIMILGGFALAMRRRAESNHAPSRLR